MLVKSTFYVEKTSQQCDSDQIELYDDIGWCTLKERYQGDPGVEMILKTMFLVGQVSSQ